MRYRREILLTSLAVVVALLVGAAVPWAVRMRSPMFRITSLGARSRDSGGLGISGGNLVAVEGRPAVLLGTVTRPGKPEELTSLILFKYRLPARGEIGNGADFHIASDDKKAEARESIVIGGRRVEAAYRIELDPSRSGEASESLEVGGRVVDMGDGRVFLLDLTAATPAYHQRAVALPIVPPLRTTGDLERFVEAILRSLEGQDAEVRSFLR